ncbi:MAG: polysaccharide deacetylase family protein [Acidimicrobiales bacterium]
MTLVTLTFDNGPDATVTPRVLDVLADRGLTAGFFVVGTQLQQPGAVALAQRAVAEGHWVGNHSMHHKVPLGDEPDPAYADAEITATQRLLDEAGVTHTERYFRPFGRGGLLGPHLLSPRARDLLVEGGYTCVLWNSVPRDWEDPAGWVDTARAHLDAEPSGHTVVVLHDLPTGAMDHLERFLDRLAADGHACRAELPAHCVPIAGGVARAGHEAFVSATD